MPTVTNEERTDKPLTQGVIFFGRKRPKNWKENLTAQKDQKLQLLLRSWYEEKDTELKKQRWQEAMDYWAKRRLELGFKDKEE